MDLSQISPGTLALNAKATRSSSELEGSGSEPLRRACQEFESVFLTYLLKTMRNTIPKTEHSLSGTSGDMYMSMMDEELARAASRGPGIGLATAMYRQLSQNKNI